MSGIDNVNVSVVRTIETALAEILTAWSFERSSNEDFAYAIESALRNDGHTRPGNGGEPLVNGHGKWCASLHAPPGETYACDCNEEGSG